MNAKKQRQSAAPSPLAGPTWQFEDVTLTRVIESEEALLSPFELYPDCTPEDIDRNVSWLTSDLYSQDQRLLVISIQSFLIRSAEKTILIDTCSGNCKQRQRPFFSERRWDWLDKLRSAGVAPEDVNIVACSHLHVDHVGWNTRLENGRWVPTFPNARYLIARKEWDFWRSMPGIASLARTGDFISDSVLPIINSGKADLIDDHFKVSERVSIEPGHGHTPGHFLVSISCSDQRAVLTGDLMHTPLQLRYPNGVPGSV